MDERKASQMAAAFILRNGRPMGALKLMKLMYLADRRAMERFVFPITLDGIYALRNGMALSRTYDLMIRKTGTPTNGEWVRFIGPQSSQGVNVRQNVGMTDLDSLSRNDVEVIDHVWHRYGQLTRDELVHDVHHRLKEWIEHWEDENRKTGSIPVPYEKLCKTLRGMSKKDASEAAEEIDYFRRVREKGENLRELV